MATRRPAPPPGGDWRRRMRVRGSWPQHAIARFGWLIVGGVVGLACALLGTIGVLTSADNDLSGVPGVVAVVAVSLLIFGGMAGLVVGLPLQFAMRAWLRSPNREELEAMRLAQAHARPLLPPGLRPGSWWAGVYEQCVRSVTGYHAVVRTLPHGPARTWLADAGRRLDWELDEAQRLALLGESLDSAQAPGGETVMAIAARLDTARVAFAQTTEQAASIALDLRSDTAFVEVRAQLDVLAAQAPHLRTEPT